MNTTFNNTAPRLMLIERTGDAWRVTTHWRNGEKWQVLTTTYVTKVTALLGCVATVNARPDYTVKVKG